MAKRTRPDGTIEEIPDAPVDAVTPEPALQAPPEETPGAQATAEQTPAPEANPALPEAPPQAAPETPAAPEVIPAAPAPEITPAVTPEAVPEAVPEANPLDDIHMTLEQFLAHRGLTSDGYGPFVVGALIRAVGVYPRFYKAWNEAYVRYIGDL